MVPMMAGFVHIFIDILETTITKILKDQQKSPGHQAEKICSKKIPPKWF